MKASAGWLTRMYRGMYIHVIAFPLIEMGGQVRPPGQKWGYLIAVTETRNADPRQSLACGPAGDGCDYFTPGAAEQAALYYARLAVDIGLELG